MGVPGGFPRVPWAPRRWQHKRFSQTASGERTHAHKGAHTRTAPLLKNQASDPDPTTLSLRTPVPRDTVARCDPKLNPNTSKCETVAQNPALIWAPKRTPNTLGNAFVTLSLEADRPPPRPSAGIECAEWCWAVSCGGKTTETLDGHDHWRSVAIAAPAGPACLWGLGGPVLATQTKPDTGAT